METRQEQQAWTSIAAANAGGPKEPIKNTAGTILPGVEVTEVIQEFRLERCYTDLSFLAEISSYANKCNLDQFLGAKPGHVLCKGARWQKVIESNQGNVLAYWRVEWEFQMASEEWKSTYLSVGYKEIKGGKLVNVLDDEGDPVTDPANLDASGASTKGSPAPIYVFPHPQIAMIAKFGSVS